MEWVRQVRPHCSLLGYERGRRRVGRGSANQTSMGRGSSPRSELTLYIKVAVGLFSKLEGYV